MDLKCKGNKFAEDEKAQNEKIQTVKDEGVCYPSNKKIKVNRDDMHVLSTVETTAQVVENEEKACAADYKSSRGPKAKEAEIDENSSRKIHKFNREEDADNHATMQVEENAQASPPFIEFNTSKSSIPSAIGKRKIGDDENVDNSNSNKKLENEERIKSNNLTRVALQIDTDEKRTEDATHCPQPKGYGDLPTALETGPALSKVAKNASTARRARRKFINPPLRRDWIDLPRQAYWSKLRHIQERSGPYSAINSSLYTTKRDRSSTTGGTSNQPLPVRPEPKSQKNAEQRDAYSKAKAVAHRVAARIAQETSALTDNQSNSNGTSSPTQNTIKRPKKSKRKAVKRTPHSSCLRNRTKKKRAVARANARRRSMAPSPDSDAEDSEEDEGDAVMKDGRSEKQIRDDAQADALFPFNDTGEGDLST